MRIEYFAYMLLALLAASVLAGLIRKLKGGSFLPEPAPGEDRHLLDERGRWWREDEKGTLEEAFRRPKGTTPAAIARLFIGTFHSQFVALVWLVSAAVIMTGLWELSSLSVKAGLPSWLPWIAGVVAYISILKYGRRRNWF